MSTETQKIISGTEGLKCFIILWSMIRFALSFDDDSTGDFFVMAAGISCYEFTKIRIKINRKANEFREIDNANFLW